MQRARKALRLLDRARDELRTNELLAELQISDAMRELEIIYHTLDKARQGVSAPGEGDDDE